MSAPAPRSLLLLSTLAALAAGCEGAGGVVNPPRRDRAVAPGDHTPPPIADRSSLPSDQPILTLPDQPAPPPKDTGVFGTKTCREIDTCLWGCGAKDTDQACWDACAVQGSQDAQAKFKAIDACWTIQVTGGCASACVVGSAFSCWVCLYQTCPTQFQGCFNAPAGGTGLSTCKQIYTCLQGCSANDSLCLLKCIWSGTGAAQSQYAAVDKCQAQAVKGGCKTSCASTGSTACKTCLSNACAVSYAACG